MKLQHLCRRCCNTVTNRGTYSRRREQDPLRILFCGADAFSVESLKALYTEFKQNPLIASIDVVTKRDKKTGRGLKNLTSTPVNKLALDLELPVHQLDTFRGWTSPSYQSEDINLVIAVSFGLLIPPRILNNSKYGGLNVHPSLLPDLRGAAPIQWAIIEGRTHTGISIQTLHPSKFDEGVVLDQSSSLPLVNASTATFEDVRDQLAPIGAEMLVHAIRNGLYIPPYEAVKTQHLETLAPKIKSTDRGVDFRTMTELQILNRNRAIPRLFAFANQGESAKVRIVFGRDLKQFCNDIPVQLMTFCAQIPAGVPYAVLKSDARFVEDPLFVNTIDGSCIVLSTITIEGGVPGPGARTAIAARLMKPFSTVDDFTIYSFDNPLVI